MGAFYREVLRQVGTQEALLQAGPQAGGYSERPSTGRSSDRWVLREAFYRQVLRQVGTQRTGCGRRESLAEIFGRIIHEGIRDGCLQATKTILMYGLVTFA